MEAVEDCYWLIGGSDPKSEKDAHAHEGSTRLIDANHYERQAVGYSDGVPASTQYFSMSRQP